MPLAGLSDWTARADRLAAAFAATAARHDRERSFPGEHVAEARAGGWAALAVPAERGGAGASLHDLCVLQERLGRGDASSALGLGMHHVTVGSPGAAATGWPEELYARLCAEVVSRGALCNGLISEPEQGSPARGGLPRTTATRVEGGWRLDGRKTWSTWLPALDLAVVSARAGGPGDGPEPAGAGGAPGRGRLGLFLVDLRSAGVGRDPTFDALGLRATASGTLVLDGVDVADEAVVSLRAAGAPDPRGPAHPAWFQLVSSAVYVGTAHAAREAVARFCRERRPNDRAEPIAELPAVRLRLGRIEALVRTARLVVLAAARAWEEARPEAWPRLLTDVGIAKLQATGLAWRACEEAMRLAGGPGMLSELPLERHLRDVRGGLIHPPQEDVALDALGRALAEGEAGDGEALV